MTLKELQEQRSQQAAQIREMAKTFEANNKAWKDDAERSAWDQLNKDYDATLRSIETEQQKDAVTARTRELDEHDTRSQNHGLTKPGREDTQPAEERTRAVDEETRSLALAGFFRSNADEAPSRRVREAMQRCRIGMRQGGLTIIVPPTRVARNWQQPFRLHNPAHARDLVMNGEQRALNTFQVAKGGVLIPGSFVTSLEVNMLFYGGVRQVAEQLVTSTGDEMTWPTADDSSNEGEQLGEAGNIGSSSDPAFATTKWRAYKFSSKPVLVDFELLEDSALELPGMLGAMLGERLGRITNRKATLGSGNGTMRGFMTSAARGKLTTGSTFTFNDVIDLEHSVDPAYRAGGSFMCHDTIVAHMRKLIDGNGRYLWMAGDSSMDPDTLHGRKVTLNQVMDDTVTNGDKSLAFGDFTKVKIRRVNQIRIYRLQERYRDNDQDAFVAFVREDSNVLNAGTNPIKYLEVGA